MWRELFVRTAIIDFHEGTSLKSFTKWLVGRHKLVAVPYDELRSKRQNDYLWGLLDIMEDYTGRSRQSQYNIYLEMFGARMHPFTTSKYPKKICAWFLKKVTQHAYEEYWIVYPPYDEDLSRPLDYYLL